MTFQFSFQINLHAIVELTCILHATGLKAKITRNTFELCTKVFKNQNLCTYHNCMLEIKCEYIKVLALLFDA